VAETKRPPNEKYLRRPTLCFNETIQLIPSLFYSMTREVERTLEELSTIVKLFLFWGLRDAGMR
jgi:hypothetical protein